MFTTFNNDIFGKNGGKIEIPEAVDIVFVSDMFVQDHIGGAELSSEALIKSSPLNVYKLQSRNVTMELLSENVNKLEDYKNSAKYFKSILKINPDHAESRFELISIYQLLNRPREANKECDILYMLNRELYYSARFCNM